MTTSSEQDPDDGAGEHGQISPGTTAVERVDEEATATADRLPTPEEEEAADRHGPVDPSVAEHEREMQELGAHVKGEGQIEPGH